MILYNIFLIILLPLALFFFYIKNKNFFFDQAQKLSHKQFTSSKKHTPLLGGWIVLYGVFFFLDYEIEFKIIFSLIFLIGFLSDIFILKKAIIKLFLQTITILIFIIYFDLKVNRSGIFFLDQLLNFDLFNYFFVIFCFIVLINGSNFIDGVNTNLLGYYFILLLIIFFTAENNNLEFNPNLIKILMLFIFFALTLNFFGIIFTGDAGAYSISFLIGSQLINFTNNNEIISPLFVVLLLWYPAFEGLFSLIRKKIENKSAMLPDINHLHQLIFLFFKNKYKLKNNILNTLTGMSLNFYNLSIFMLGINYFNNPIMLFTLIIINMLVYIYITSKLRNCLFKN